MMQKKVGDDHVPTFETAARGIGLSGPIHDVHNSLLDRPSVLRVPIHRCLGHQRLTIQQSHFDFGPGRCQRLGDTQHQAAVARTKLEDSEWLCSAAKTQHIGQRPEHNGARAHHPMHALQITSRTHRGRIVFCQAVKRFSGDNSLHHHCTFSNAPWQLNPAPNDDSHHHPPGASSASAASSTKYTNALDRLPYSRSIAAL